jgi:CHAD domain-containing protein/CYTH domain-containing protein
VKLPSEILALSPEEAARRIALLFLDQARAAAFRLDDEEDSEALHDFRVSLRRLRSTLRAWRTSLKKSAPKQYRRALRAIQNATGAGRDAEVALAWLASERASLRPAHRSGCDWMAERMEERRRRCLTQARSGLRRDFDRVREPLQRGLEVMTLEVHLSQPRPARPFGNALAEKARDQAQQLAKLLGRVESSEERSAAHRTRIACKRLRYLVEPVGPHVETASAVVRRCKRLQDALGELNDAYVLHDELGSALEVAAAEHARRLHELASEQDTERLRRETRRSQRSGLLELTRRLQHRIETLLEQLRDGWIADGMGPLIEEVEQMAAQLDRAVHPGLEIERKYLLRRLPDLGGRAEIEEIDQGWLPGERLHERLRRVQSGSATRYFRTIKFGQGVQRTEIEEPATQELFDSLWPLTEGCRVRKRRHKVREGDLAWEIDEFLDRELYLAEVELAHVSDRPKIPEWLAPCIEREVTDDPRYTNLRLAR